MHISEEAYLVHYGVKGMKWGVRRYQNYDGSYTKRGVKRFREAEERYDSAKIKYKEAKTSGASRAEIKNARQDVKLSKRKLTKSYKRLKQDKLADQGKSLYRSGKTITGNSQRAAFTQGAIVVGANVTASLLTRYGHTTMASRAGAGIAVGGTALNAAIQAKNRYQDKRLRAYYAHGR